MQRVYKRVVNWNAKRYEREYDHELALALLNEECEELLEATNDVDCLDAACDIAYVAFGALWKLDIPEFALHEMLNDKYNELITNKKPDTVREAIDALAIANELSDRAHRLCDIIVYSLAEMFSLGLTMDTAIHAMLIVCNSNDTKTVAKTASNVKANKSKGEFFQPPEPKLAALLEANRD